MNYPSPEARLELGTAGPQPRRSPVRAPTGGFSLLEASVTLGLFALLLVLLAMASRAVSTVWRNVSEGEASSRELRRAAARLQRDLDSASRSRLSTQAVPASLAGGGRDGDALWFLSNLDEDGVPQRKADGDPFWLRNILYYLTVPNPDPCAGGTDGNGYDDRCPHKVLVRKVIDSGTPSVTTDESTEESLLSSLTGLLDRPAGHEVAGMGGPGCRRTELVAVNLLQFRATPGLPGEWSLDLRAVAELEARRQLTVGVAPLATSRYTTQFLLSVFPRNP